MTPELEALIRAEHGECRACYQRALLDELDAVRASRARLIKAARDFLDSANDHHGGYETSAAALAAIVRAEEPKP